ncbi:MAG: LLM class flavin-dependent oxidoreductase, partial [Ktedonobacterales bacterium]
MQYGFVIPVGDVGEQVAMARELEAAGWDGVFVADGVYGMSPWVALGAMAASTTRMRLGTLLTPVSRRRPWTLASEVATLDRLSGGRAVLPVGLGAIDTGFAAVGEATDRATRAQLLDEGLDVVTSFWRGEPFRFDGTHYHVDWSDMRWAYRPAQSPRVPIWTVAAWPSERSMARAL